MAEMGLLLKRLRLEAGITQERLAERLDVTQQHVSAIERGVRPPPWDYLIAFANAVGANIVELLRSAGLIAPSMINVEQEIAAMIAAHPHLAVAFEYARTRNDPGVLADLDRYARMVLRDREAVEFEKQGGGATEETGEGDH